MDFVDVFTGFLHPVAYGSAAVVVLLVIVRLRTPRRSPVLADRTRSR
jgi:hypothetical protein